MGLASVTLGYAYPAVNEAVARQLDRGSIFSLPAPAEVEVSERLTRIIPCADMARFLKTGSEANSAAVRVARAATGRDVIVFCGYSGWHDWYAVTTPRSKGIPMGGRGSPGILRRRSRPGGLRQGDGERASAVGCRRSSRVHARVRGDLRLQHIRGRHPGARRMP